MSIVDVDERFGTFDYIICHGVYSWVPEAVRDKILEICSRRLAPSGVAYVSYNTYPGWHARGMVREMMAFHVRGAASAADRVEKARELPGRASSGSCPTRRVPTPGSSGPRGSSSGGWPTRTSTTSTWRRRTTRSTSASSSALAAAKGLRYLAEARTPGLLENLPPEAREVVEAWADDEVAAEQYLDFLCNRTFRRTLLCRADRRAARSALGRGRRVALGQLERRPGLGRGRRRPRTPRGVPPARRRAPA